jgi:hypothetical protein
MRGHPTLPSHLTDTAPDGLPRDIGPTQAELRAIMDSMQIEP